MNNMLSKETVGLREDRLLTMLERLLELPTNDVNSTLFQTTQLVAEVLAADKVEAFLHDTATDALVAPGTHDMPVEMRQNAAAIDQLLLVNGGRIVEVFLSGVPYLSEHADQDSGGLVGGMKSEIATIFQVGTQHRGVLLASSSRPAFFSEQDLHFLEAVARWVGIVIHRAELVKRIRQEAVEQGRRLAAEELLTIMAHDLRNYLTPLRGRLELIEQRAYREGREQDMHDVIAASKTFHLLERVISDLLDVARLNQGIFTIHPQRMNMVHLVYEVVPAFSGPETPISIYTPQEAVLSGDPDRLRQVLENLLANAIKYAPKHTPITVRVGRERRMDGPWILLTVSNEGPGIPPELSSQFLRPFTAGMTTTGLGLGLYLAHRIAEAHYGTLTVDSPAGQGVQVTLGLPVEDEDFNEFNHFEESGPIG
ncbi:MAG TPA: GAF domain-containing sensor histidine kinase [Ktedonobacteraceae bacterium]